MNREVYSFFKYLSLYTSSSLDIVSAVSLSEKRVRSRKLKKTLIEIRTMLENGVSITESFELLYKRKYIDSVSWTMIVSSYKAGVFNQACRMISEYQKNKLLMNRSFVASLAYPAGVFISSLLMIYFLITIIFPKILPLFNSLQMELPFATKCIVFVSNVLGSAVYMGICIASIVTVSAVVVYARKTKIIEKYVMFKAPLSYVFLPREYYRISISLYSLLWSTVPLPEAIQICAESSSYNCFSESLKRIKLEIEAGKKISEQLDKEYLFEHEWTHMCAVGEMTGSLPSIFSDLAIFYEKQFSDRLMFITRWSEPLSLFLSAIVILFVALSVLQPMYSIIQYIKPV